MPGQTGLKNATLKGGRVTRREKGWSCQGIGSALTPPVAHIAAEGIGFSFIYLLTKNNAVGSLRS